MRLPEKAIDTITRTLGEGEGQFSLKLRIPTDAEVRVEVEESLKAFQRQLGVILDWSGVEDEQGNPIPFSAEALAAALSEPHAAVLIAGAVNELFAGRLK